MNDVTEYLAEKPVHYPAAECAAWRKKWNFPFPCWRQPIGLEKYAAFVKGWGFQMHHGFGWVVIDAKLCDNYYGQILSEIK